LGKGSREKRMNYDEYMAQQRSRSHEGASPHIQHGNRSYPQPRQAMATPPDGIAWPSTTEQPPTQPNPSASFSSSKLAGPSPQSSLSQTSLKEEENESASTMELATLPMPRAGLSGKQRFSLSWKRRFGAISLMLFDVVLLNIGFYLAFWFRSNISKALISGSLYVPPDLQTLRPFQIGFVTSIIFLVWLRGLYRMRITGTLGHQFWHLANAAFMGFALYSVYEYIVHTTSYDNSRAVIAFTYLSAIIVPFIGRVILVFIISVGYRLNIGRHRVLVIGAGRAAKVVMQHLTAYPGLGYQIIGYVGDRSNTPESFGRFHSLGLLDDLEYIIRDNNITEAVIALPSSRQGQIVRTIRICERNDIRFRMIPDMQEFSLSRVDVEEIEGLPLFDLRRAGAAFWQRRVKRFIDVVGATLVLTLGSPIWLFITLIIRLDSPGPAIYRQARIGLYGQPFITYKFRSMYVDADARRAQLHQQNRSGRGLFKIKDDPRRTRVGSFIRKTSLDELPQIINVLRGEMSLVGPRPPLPEEYARYEEWEKRRMEMPPGMTGLWQIRGRSDITFEEMVLMDLYFIENWSLLLDIQIMLKTIPAVLLRRGAY
jgi:exopolysaccharide biosynthesis polyprenyl glycosylphosphotransferase